MHWRVLLDWRGWPRGVVGALAAAGSVALAGAAAVISVSLLGQTSGPPQAARESALAGAVSHIGAVQLLITASDAAARSQPVTATSRQFAYLESLVSYGTGGGPASLQTHLRQTWTPAADLCAGGLMIEHGQRYALNPPASGVSGKPRCPDPGRLNDPTIRLLDSLPTRPPALLGLFRKVRIRGLTPDLAAFETISGILRASVVPPAVSAALYRATAMLPETTLVPQNYDPAGRPGVGMLFTYQNLQLEWIFEPRTFRFLGELDFSDGKLTGESATLVRAIVGRAGQIPASG